MRELLGGLHPGAGQSARDRMARVQHVHLETVPRPVPGIEARSLWNAHDLTFGRDHQAGPKALVAPPQADHVVIRAPVEKRIVRGVVDHQAAAPADVFFESLLDPPGPANPGVSLPAVEVVDDHAIPGEVRIPGVPRRSRSIRRRAGRDIHREAPALEEQGLQLPRSGLPVVVVDPVHNQDGINNTMTTSKAERMQTSYLKPAYTP